jgi:putative PEP-CTERM system histidine kinase
MTDTAADLKIYGYALALAVHTGFALHLLRQGYARRDQGAAQRAFLGAVVASAGWALMALVDPLSRSVTPAFAAAALDLLRYGLWFAFLLLLLRPALARNAARESRLLAPAAGLLVALAAALLIYRAALGLYEPDGSRAFLGAALALPLLGMVLVEQLFRNLAEDARWNAKPLCLGLAIVFLFDLYIHSEAMLFGRFDPDALSVRGAVHMLAVPLLFLSSRRRADWIRRLQVSRSAAFYSATLLLVGAYLLLMSAVGYYVRFFGGDWGRGLQLGLLAMALAALTALVLSGTLRARVRVFVGKNFFSYRYDYREEWLRFTAMLSTKGSPQEVGGLVVHGLADMVESPGGSLFMRSGSGSGTDGNGDHRQSARWNQPALDHREPADSPFCAFLQERGWVIDLDEYRNSPRRYGELPLPTWLLADATVWLVVPLPAGDELLGFVTLTRPRAPMELNWEVRDLLKTASRQAAGFLAQMQATEALLEARKFDAFNRMSAFVVHDLKNIVTQLSLMMKNAQRLHANPEFQQDMLLTVDSSLEKMRRLMLQLREGATPPGGARGVELAPILRRLQIMAQEQGRAVEIECADGLATRGHDERLERVLGHLVHNALDATPPEGRVWVRAARYSGQVRIEVGDTGVGMSEDFVQNKLFRPFSSTKRSGMGIGSYESFQYIRELGGSMAVDSQPGRGTVITVQVPLFDAHAGSDLQVAAPTGAPKP